MQSGAACRRRVLALFALALFRLEGAAAGTDPATQPGHIGGWEGDFKRLVAFPDFAELAAGPAELDRWLDPGSERPLEADVPDRLGSVMNASSTPQATVRTIYRYPVKGLSPEPLAGTTLRPGATVVGDRSYAIENGPSGFDPARPGYLPKQRFLMLMKNERLARLDTHYDDAAHVLTIRDGGAEVARGDLRTHEGRAAIEGFFAVYSAGELRGPPKVLAAAGHSFSDVARKVVSIINLASVAAIEDMTGRPVDPLRFRGNLYVDGWPAWREFDLLGEEIAIGPLARAKVVKRIVRCAATNVEPGTGIRDLEIPATLLRHLGHADCGIYAEVTAGGAIAPGDAVDLSALAPSPPPTGRAASGRGA
jgi:uncharacterized protein YcbX